MGDVIVRGRRASRLVLWLVATVAGASAAADELRLDVEGAGAPLKAVPVVVDLPADVALVPGDYQLDPTESGSQLEATCYMEDGRPKLAFILDHHEGVGTRSFVVERRESAEAARFTARPAASGALAILSRGKPLTTFELGAHKPYLFPVIGPTGDPLTRAYPMQDVEGEERDHPHQRSFWFTHGDVNGVDFWGSDPLNRPGPRTGKIQETEREVEAAGAATAVVRTRNDWLDATGKRLLADLRRYRFWDDGQTRWIDVDVRMMAVEGPVTFGDTKEGMFGVRVPSSMDVKRKQGGRIVNAEGVTDQAAWGKPSPWVDYSGPVNGKRLGIAILNHPSSFRHPTTWHVRDYGLFAANPFGYRDFGIAMAGAHETPKGEAIEFRYRVVLHAGDSAQAQIAMQYAGYATPPRVQLGQR
jgi:hypothetical protein